MIKLDKGTLLTDDLILKIIRQHKFSVLPRLTKLKRYYLAQSDILNRARADDTSPNNKIANSYAGYITDTLVGYFVGEPITYNCEDEAVLKTINNIFDYNNEADENTELARAASIYGVAYERLYVDEEGKLRFKIMPTEESIPIYDTTVENNLLFFIRYWSERDIVKERDIYCIEVIDENSVTTYECPETLSSIIKISEEEHYFQSVPIVVFKNNEDEIGDFEKVITLIDAYDKMESDSLNDFEYFTDAYLALYGFHAEPEDAQEMKRKRILLMDEGTKAEWILKNENDSSTENMKSRLDNDIHKFSFCPNMSDEKFASNASGVAIKFKTMGTENLVSNKERKFKRGLQRRLMLIGVINKLLGGGFDWRMIGINFSRNIPANDMDAAEMISKLHGIVSDETLMTQLSFVDDIWEEKRRIEEQRETEKEENPLLYSLSYQTRAMNKEEKKDEQVK